MELSGNLVLHVDAHPLMRLAVSQFHERCGANSTLVSFETGNSVCHLVQTGGIPDVVLVGERVGGYDGVDLISWLRGQPSLDGVRLVLVAERLNAELVCEALSCGADGVFCLKDLPSMGKAIFGDLELRLYV